MTRLLKVATCCVGLVGGLGLPVGLAQAQSAGPNGATVRASFEDGRWLSAREAIAFDISPDTTTGVSGLAIVIANTDWTGLFERQGQTWRYAPAALSLPRGESPVAVYTVDPDGTWTEVATFTLHVLTQGGFERADITPSASFTLAGQVAVDPTPEDGVRERYQDLTFGVGWLGTLVRSGWTTTTQVNTVGTARRELALRFGELEDDAPLFDLSDYLVSFENQRGGFSVGHLSWDIDQHLVSGFQTRGVSATARLGPALDVAVHAMNASTIVGWANPVGLNRRAHQALGGTLGVEFAPARPGGARLTATLVDASALPIAGFTEALVNDAEESTGFGVRFVGRDPAERVTVDAGLSRSRFTNPEDPLLAQDADLVPTEETTRGARYADVSVALLPPGERMLTAAFRHNRVDPLYRSITAQTQADLLENTVEITGGVRQITAQAAFRVSHDDLDDLPSLMRTTTRGVTWRAAVPLSSLDPEMSAALPLVSYAFDRTRQFGDGLPENSLFDSESQVPDLVTTNQTIDAEWQAARGRVTYQWNRSMQDNRQPGRELADFRTLVHTFGVGLTPSTVLDIVVDLSFENISALEQETRDSTKRVGLNATWQIRPTTSVTGSLSQTITGNDPRTRNGRASDLNLQFTQDIVLMPRSPDRLRGQVFVRFIRQTNRLTDLEFFTDDRQQSWVINTGLTFRIF